MTITEDRAAMSSADINDLPDSDFAYIESGGSKDSEGKTTPRDLRHFPIHDAAHVRNALARLSSSPFGDKAKSKVVAAAHKFGIEVDESKLGAERAAFELRKRRRGSMIRKSERRGLLLEMRAKPDGTGGTTFEFEGYGATFDDPFEMWDPWGEAYSEVVRPGAFSRTLAAAPDVPFLIGHNDQGIPLARTRNGTMRLSQDSKGLHVLATMDGSRSDVRNLASAVERGDLDEMSIGFVTMGQEWSPDWETRAMLDLELHRGDVSAVALAANPATAGSTMTALPAEVLGQARPAESRDGGGYPDTASPDYDAQVNGLPAVKCPYTKTNGCGQMCPGGSRFCSNCGGSLYSADGQITISEDGVPQESDSASPALAAQRDLERRRRELDLLALAG